MIKFDDEYYKSVINKYGYNAMDFKPIDFSLSNISSDVMKEKWLCHYKAEKFVKGVNNKKQIITTGIGLSGTPHMGTLSQILRAIFLQKAGFEVQFVLGDLDSYNARNQSLEVLKERADKYTKFIKKLGFDEITKLRFGTCGMTIYDLEYKNGEYVIKNVLHLNDEYNM